MGTKDAQSTGNMRKHAKKCWGSEVLEAADAMKGRDEAREKVVGSILKNGSITQAFEPQGKGKQHYSHRQLTRTEIKAAMIRWAAKSKRPFTIVNDEEFRFLMKTGRPSLYIPSASTVSRDTKRVFGVVRNRVSKLLRVCR